MDNKTMKAVLVQSPGGPEQLTISDWPIPVPEPNQLLIKVEATALNRADILQREGKYPPPAGASPILGLELAGRVAAIGNAVKKWKEGDAVFGLIPGGGYAQYAVIHEEMALAIPTNLSPEEAVAIPEVFLTAFQALYRLAKLQANEQVLIHAGASGVGTATIQLAKEIGATVFVTASKNKHKACLAIGASKAIDYKVGPFEPEIKQFTNGKGVNVIVDFVGGPYFKQNIECLATDGRLIQLATLAGGKVDELDIRKILIKRISVIGSTLRSRSLDYQVALTNDFAQLAIPRFKDGRLKPVIDRIMNWEQIKEAHDYMESNQNTGKIILRIS